MFTGAKEAVKFIVWEHGMMAMAALENFKESISKDAERGNCHHLSGNLLYPAKRTVRIAAAGQKTYHDFGNEIDVLLRELSR